MKRLVVTVAACVIALAAPAQVWCHATCAATGDRQATSAVTPHCPPHDQSSGRTLASAHQDQCRAPEGSRSANPMRLFAFGSATAILTEIWNAVDAQTVPACRASSRVPQQTLAFNYSTPLRI